MDNITEREKMLRIGTFGEYIKSRREQRGLTYTQMAKVVGTSIEHIRQIENGWIPLNADLRKIAKALDHPEGSFEWAHLFGLASIATGSIPLDILKDDELRSVLPFLFRILREGRPTEKQWLAIKDLLVRE